jgi:hypothetical protein
MLSHVAECRVGCAARSAARAVPLATRRPLCRKSAAPLASARHVGTTAGYALAAVEEAVAAQAAKRWPACPRGQALREWVEVRARKTSTAECCGVTHGSMSRRRPDAPCLTRPLLPAS